MPDGKIQVQFTAEFKSQLQNLAKRYRQIRGDLQPLLEQLQNGEVPGEQIAGTGYTVFKVGVKNSDIQKGKRAGYRVIYQLDAKSVVLLLIYTKSDLATVSATEIQAVIQNSLQD